MFRLRNKIDLNYTLLSKGVYRHTKTSIRVKFDLTHKWHTMRLVYWKHGYSGIVHNKYKLLLKMLLASSQQQNILRKTIEEYIDSVPSLSLNTRLSSAHQQKSREKVGIKFWKK